MEKMIPANISVIQDLEQGAVQDVHICTEAAKWILWTHSEMVMGMCYKASFAAYSELMVEKLKKRIEAANGSVMDKVADALTESIGKEWQAMIQKSSAKKELHEKLAKIFSEGSQKQK